jgi:hypothetical protein
MIADAASVKTVDGATADTCADSGRSTSVSGPVPSPRAILRGCVAQGIDPSMVVGCLDLTTNSDALFAKGWRSGADHLTRIERCAVAAITGHVGESVVELVLDSLGWFVLWHFSGPGRHGVDLVFLAPGDLVVVVEVKATLVPGRIPRLSRTELIQMSTAWVDKTDNPGMAELGLESGDVYGGIAVVNFADMTWRVALTADFVQFRPTIEAEQLTDLGWLLFTKPG